MAGQDFQISMILRAVNQMSPVIQQAARQMQTLQKQVTQLNATSNKGTWFNRAISNVDSFSKKLKSAQDAMDKLVKSGEKDLWTGGIMALPLVGMIKSASQVQNTQTSLQLTGMSQGQVNSLTTQAQETMRKTMFNTAQVLGIDRSLTQVGMDYSKIQRVGTSATYLAELEANRNGADPNETAKQFAQMSEQLGISMDPTKVNQLADMVNRISTVTSASVSTLSDSSRYFNMVGRIQGLNASDIMMTQGLAARFGLEGSIGGTNLKDFFERLNPQSHMGTVMGQPIVKAFEQMGWLSNIKTNSKGQITSASDVFHDSKGNLNSADQIFSILGQTYQRMGNREQFNALMTRVFGQQGQSIAAAVAQNPQAFATLHQQMSNVPTVSQGIGAYQGTFNQQFHAFTSTLSDFGRQVGTMILPSLTGYLQQLNAALPKVQSFIDKHKDLIKTLAEIWGGLAAFKIASGVAKIAVGGPARELLGVGRGATGAVRGGLRVARSIGNRASIYREFRQIGGSRMLSLRAAVEHGHPMLAKAGNAGSAVWNATVAGASKTVNAMKTLGSWTARTAASFARMSAQAIASTAKMAAQGTMSVLRFGGRMIWLGIQAMATGLRMAAAWVIGLGPVGWIIAGVIAVVVLLVAAWKNNWGHIQQHTKAVVDWIVKAFHDMINFFKQLPGDTLKIGKDIINGLWNGIKSMGSWFKNAVGGWIKDHIPGPFKKILGINSPSRLFASYGLNIVQGLSNGIVGNAHHAQNASGTLAKRVAGGFSVSTSGRGRGAVHVENHYHIRSTDPKKAAREVDRRQDKYWRSRDPKLARA